MANEPIAKSKSLLSFDITLLNPSSTSARRMLPEIVLLTSYPPRECGIATYSKDLVMALNQKFADSFKLSICPLELNGDSYVYPDEIQNRLATDSASGYLSVANRINSQPDIDLVVVQHEFGLFSGIKNGVLELLKLLEKPVITTFHTVLQNPKSSIKERVQQIAARCQTIIVMTQNSRDILRRDYDIPGDKITVIPHGTHLVPYANKTLLKQKYQLSGKRVLTTFGLLGPGKSIETTLNALPAIVSRFPDTVFLVLGKTHPSLIKEEGERYRQFLEATVDRLGLHNHVRFVDRFLPLPELLEYLQLTDIYLFTSKDPHQAVSGTFSYALACGCPVISTPIPHAKEVLKNGAGRVFDFERSDQLSEAVLKMLEDSTMCQSLSLNGLHSSATTAWENSAIAHAKVFEKLSGKRIKLKYHKPPVNLSHIKKMTTEVGIIQFSKINQPDVETGYTLDDNARALIVCCRHYTLTKDEADLAYIRTYLQFIYGCFRPDGKFVNYVDKECQLTQQNEIENLEDANGRAIWSLGYLLSMAGEFPPALRCLEDKARFLFIEFMREMGTVSSPRAMAFIIKGLFYFNRGDRTLALNLPVKRFADRLVSLYTQASSDDWSWYESSLTYGNSVLPQSLLMAFLMTDESNYLRIAKSSFNFLLSRIFSNNKIRVISNQTWMAQNDKCNFVYTGGEQPIDVAYTILALRSFHEVFPNEGYDKKMEQAFNWFLGENSLGQIVYNPCTGGCYDGLELHNVNLNQGAESTLSYHLARMAFDDLP